MGNLVNALIALGPTLARIGRGAVVTGNRTVPTRNLELYDRENARECRPVREALTELDLDVIVYPVPRNGTRFREQLAATGGGDSVPFLHDPNTGERRHGAGPIVEYLYTRYAPENVTPPGNLLPLASIANALRSTRGKKARPSRAPAQPLELYSFEASPYSRLIRETLCELEISYLLHNVGKSPGLIAEWLPPMLREKRVKDYRPETENRLKLVARGGHMMVPYLVDPNTGVALYESADIQAYLLKTYGN